MWRRYKVNRWMSKLHDSDSDQRKAAILALGELQAVEGFESICRTALTDTANDVWETAGRVAATLDQKGLAQTLLSLLYAKDASTVRERVLRLIQFAPDPRMVPALTAILLNKEAEHMRWWAAQALGNLGVKNPLPVLTRQLEHSTKRYSSCSTHPDDDTFLVKYLAESIGGIGDQSGIGPLVRVLVKLVPEFGTERGTYVAPESHCAVLRDREARRTVAEALARLGEAKWSKWILGDDNDGIRLANSGDSQACEIVLPRVYDRSIDEDKGAYQSVLSTLGRERASEMLVNAAAKRIGSTGAIAGALLDLGVASVVPSLQRILSDMKWAISEQQYRQDIANVILKLVEHPSQPDHAYINSIKPILLEARDREGARELIAGVRDVAALSDILRDARMGYSLRACAAKVLSKLADPRAISELSSALHDEEEDFRASVAISIGASGNTAIVPTLVKAMEIEFHGYWPRVHFSDAIANALAAIGTNDAASALLSNVAHFGRGGIVAMTSLLHEHGETIDPSILRALSQIADLSVIEVEYKGDGYPFDVSRVVDCGDLRRLAGDLLAKQH